METRSLQETLVYFDHLRQMSGRERSASLIFSVTASVPLFQFHADTKTPRPLCQVQQNFGCDLRFSNTHYNAFWSCANLMQLTQLSQIIYKLLECTTYLRHSRPSLSPELYHHIHYTLSPKCVKFFLIQYVQRTPIPVAARSKAQVCGLSPAEIVGSNPTGAWIFVCCECCVLSGRGLCDGLITRPEEPYRL